MVAGARLVDVEVLPGKTAFNEVDDHIAQGKQVVTPRQFKTQMRVNWNVTAGSNQIFPAPKGYVLACFWVNDWACQTKVNHVDNIWLVPHPHHYVIGFYVSMNVVFLMHGFDAIKQLVEQHKSGLQRELAAA